MGSKKQAFSVTVPVPWNYFDSYSSAPILKRLFSQALDYIKEVNGSAGDVIVFFAGRLVFILVYPPEP